MAYHINQSDVEIDGEHNTVPDARQAFYQRATLKGLYKYMMIYYIPHMVDVEKSDIMQLAARILRRDHPDDQYWATRLPPLLLMQLNGDKVVSQRFTIPLFIILKSETTNMALRIRVCKTLSIINTFGDGNINFMYQLMETLEGIFGSTYDTPKNVTPDESLLHVEAILSWTLLLTTLPSSKLLGWNGQKRQMLPSVKDLLKLFNSPHIILRDAAAQLIAVLLECGRKSDPNFLEDYTTDMIEAAYDLILARRRLYISNYRKVSLYDFIKYAKNRTPLNADVTFKTEPFKITSWTVYHYFMRFYSILGDGMLTHLRENPFVRGKMQMCQKVNMPRFYNPEMEKVRLFMQNIRF